MTVDDDERRCSGCFLCRDSIPAAPEPADTEAPGFVPDGGLVGDGWEESTPIEVGQVWIAQDPDALGQRWTKVVVKEGPNEGGLYGVVPHDEPEYLPSFVTADSLRASMRRQVPFIAPEAPTEGGPVDIVGPAPGSLWTAEDGGMVYMVQYEGGAFASSRWRLVSYEAPKDTRFICRWCTGKMVDGWKPATRLPAVPGKLYGQPPAASDAPLSFAEHPHLTDAYAEHLAILAGITSPGEVQAPAVLSVDPSAVPAVPFGFDPSEIRVGQEWRGRDGMDYETYTRITVVDGPDIQGQWCVVATRDDAVGCLQWLSDVAIRRDYIRTPAPLIDDDFRVALMGAARDSLALPNRWTKIVDIAIVDTDPSDPGGW